MSDDHHEGVKEEKAEDGAAEAPVKKHKRRHMLSVGVPEPPAEPTPDFAHGKSYFPEFFDTTMHFVPKVSHAVLHPIVAHFLMLGNARIAKRYCHLNPQVNRELLLKLLNTPSKWFRWGGSDLFSCTTADGHRQMIVVETNSCPSGQKNFPAPPHAKYDSDGYHLLMREVFKPMVKEREKEGTLVEGRLAVLYDKNPMETTGYASAMADVFGEPVLHVPMKAQALKKDPESEDAWRWDDNILSVRDAYGKWHVVRACFRYVTQTPWDRIPTNARTVVMNPIVCCLAGGRNKMLADKAYQLLNQEISSAHLKVRTPVTIRDVKKLSVPLHVKSMGGLAVVKNPYSNAGQGVYTICSKEELDAFMKEEHHYDKFIVQSLVGNYSWSSQSSEGRYYHTGTVPDRLKRSFVVDIRCMVVAAEDGWRPCAFYSRRAEKPLRSTVPTGMESWEMLGTNLSQKVELGEWTSDQSRLLLMDGKDFNKLGICIDNLIDAYVQTVLSCIAIDRICQKLMKGGKFNSELYYTLNEDQALLHEIAVDCIGDECLLADGEKLEGPSAQQAKAAKAKAAKSS